MDARMTGEEWTGLSNQVGRRAERSVGTLASLRDQAWLDVPGKETRRN